MLAEHRSLQCQTWRKTNVTKSNGRGCNREGHSILIIVW